jgi:hypothetical protein
MYPVGVGFIPTRSARTGTGGAVSVDIRPGTSRENRSRRIRNQCRRKRATRASCPSYWVSVLIMGSSGHISLAPPTCSGPAGPIPGLATGYLLLKNARRCSIPHTQKPEHLRRLRVPCLQYGKTARRGGPSPDGDTGVGPRPSQRREGSAIPSLRMNIQGPPWTYRRARS